MFTRIEAMWENLAERARIGRVRGRQLWRAIRLAGRRAQYAAIIDAVICGVLDLIGYATKSNIPARLSFVSTFICWMYITRQIVIPILEGELALIAGDRAAEHVRGWWDTFRGALPSWLQPLLGRPQGNPTVQNSASHGEQQSVVWHETSIGGNIFHILSTVWMWGHVLQLLFSLTPYWENGWFLIDVMLTVFVLFFVGTEDFVNIKKWRARLGYVFGAICVIYLSLMGFRTVAPGFYAEMMAKHTHTQTLGTQRAGDIKGRTPEDQWWQKQNDKDLRDLQNKYRWHLKDPQHHGWTQADDDQLDNLRELQRNLEQVDGKPQGKSWWKIAADAPMQYPEWLLVLGILVFAATRSMASGHSSH